MTIIAYRDGIIACDTATFSGHAKYLGKIKIASRPDGCLSGAAGCSSINREFLAWFKSGETDPKPEMKRGEEDSVCMIVRPDRVIEVHDLTGMSIMNVFYLALGTGEDVALGAMWAGASAEDAVRAAIEHNSGCGGEVISLKQATET